MNRQTKHMELALLNQMSREELGQVLVMLIKNDRQVQKAVIELVLASPHIGRQY